MCRRFFVGGMCQELQYNFDKIHKSEKLHCALRGDLAKCAKHHGHPGVLTE